MTREQNQVQFPENQAQSFETDETERKVNSIDFEEEIEETLDGNELDFFISNEDIGFIHGRTNREEREINVEKIEVKPEQRGEGIGTELMRRFLNEVNNNEDFSEIKKITAHVQNKDFLRILAKFFDQDKLEFYDYFSGEKIDENFENLVDNETDAISLVVKAELDDINRES